MGYGFKDGGDHFTAEGDPSESEKVGVLKSDVIYCLTKRIEELEAENKRQREWIASFKTELDSILQSNKILADENKQLREDNKRLQALANKEVDARIYAEKLLSQEPCTVNEHQYLKEENKRLQELLKQFQTAPDRDVAHRRDKHD